MTEQSYIEVLVLPGSPEFFRVTDFDAVNQRTHELFCCQEQNVAIHFADVYARSYERELRLGNVVPIRQAKARLSAALAAWAREASHGER